MLYVLLHGENGVAYNIANERCNVHLKDFAQTCAEWTGKSVVFDLPSEVERKGFSVAMNAILDNAKIKDLGWKPSFNFQQAINRTLDILK